MNTSLILGFALLVTLSLNLVAATPTLAFITNPIADPSSSLTSIAGTSAGMDLTTISIDIYDATTGLDWDGATWATGGPIYLTSTFTTDAVSGNWSFDSSAVGFIAGDNYWIEVDVNDALGNTYIYTSYFSYVTQTAVSVRINPFADPYASLTNSIVNISGTSVTADPTTMSLSIYDETTGAYWDGLAWTADGTIYTTVIDPTLVSSTGAWSFDSSTIPFLAGDRYRLDITANDNLGTGFIAEDTNVFTFTNGNVPPVIQTIPNQTIASGQILTLPINATDANGDILTYAVSFTDPTLIASIDAATGVFTFDTSAGITPGTYTFTVDVSDGINPSVKTNFNVIVVDISTTDNAPATWQTADFNITFICNSFNGCTTVYYTTDGTIPTTASSFVDATTSWQFLDSTEGSYTLQYFGVDSLGNQETIKTAANLLRLDKTAPVTITNAPGAAQTSSFSVTLSASDNISGVNFTSYNLDSAGWINGTSVSITTLGSHIIQYYSNDNAGNSETIKNVSVTLDSPPATPTGGTTGGHHTSGGSPSNGGSSTIINLPSSVSNQSATTSNTGETASADSSTTNGNPGITGNVIGGGMINNPVFWITLVLGVLVIAIVIVFIIRR